MNNLANLSASPFHSRLLFSLFLALSLFSLSLSQCATDIYTDRYKLSPLLLYTMSFEFGAARDKGVGVQSKVPAVFMQINRRAPIS